TPPSPAPVRPAAPRRPVPAAPLGSVLQVGATDLADRAGDVGAGLQQRVVDGDVDAAVLRRRGRLPGGVVAQVLGQAGDVRGVGVGAGGDHVGIFGDHDFVGDPLEARVGADPAGQQFAAGPGDDA